ncbi:MAG: EamA family transporter [Bacillota bacterium]|nr:EamA family transporter [Bacillota bacterium]
MSMLWPILLAVGADIFYQISCKSLPGQLDPFASLTITYTVGAAVCFILYEVSTKGGNIIQEWHNVNWTTFVLGVAIVGLELGSIFMYKVGWNINTGYIVKSIILAIMLIIVGFLLYKEPIKATKIAGVAVCLAGLYLINK